MQLSRHFVHIRINWFAVVMAAVGLAGPAFCQSFSGDPVEALRVALKTPVLEASREEIDSRRNLLAKRIDDLRTVGDLRRALLLQEWQDEGENNPAAEVDREARLRVATRLQQALRTALERGNVTSRLAAATMIGEMGTTIRGSGKSGFARIFTQDLATRLKDENPRVAAAAARALSNINPDPKVATSALLSLFESRDVTLRRAAATGLGNLVRKATASITAKGTSITGISASPADVVQVGAAVAPAAGKCLSDPDASVRRLSADALHQTAAALGDLLPSQEGRATASSTTERRTLAPLEELETNTQPLARALGEQGPALAGALEDSDPIVRLLVRRTLEDMAIARLRILRRPSGPPGPPPGGERGLLPAGPVNEKEPPLLASGEESEAPEVTADPLLKGLRSALPGLAAGLKDPDVRIRLASLDVLEEMGPDAASVAAAVIDATRDQNLFVRWAAARTIGKMGPVNVGRNVTELARLISDSDLDVRAVAARGLERYGPAAKAAVPALTRAVTVGDAENRIGALRALQAIGPDAQSAVPAITQALSYSDSRVRRTAAEVLGRFGPAARSALPALRQALSDSEAEVRQAASDALLSIDPTVRPSEK
jgi:HEAT repeat protein